LDPEGFRYFLLTQEVDKQQIINEELKEILTSNIKNVVRELTANDMKYLDTSMHFPRKTNKIDFNIQESKQYLIKFIEDHPVLRVNDPRRLIACIKEYFNTNQFEEICNEDGIPLWAIEYVPKDHF